MPSGATGSGLRSWLAETRSTRTAISPRRGGARSPARAAAPHPGARPPDRSVSRPPSAPARARRARGWPRGRRRPRRGARRPCGGPEVGVGIGVVVVEEVEEAEVALEGAAVALLILAEDLLLGSPGEDGVGGAGGEKARETGEVDARREHRVDEAGGVPGDEPPRAPEARAVIGVVAHDAHGRDERGAPEAIRDRRAAGDESPVRTLGIGRGGSLPAP